jgi:hypothetical protein
MARCRLERILRLRAPQIRARLERHALGLACEGAALGAVLGLAALASGTGGEFIYFQF